MQVYALVLGLAALEILPWLVLAALVVAAIYAKAKFYP
jgi:hypothetical protein